VDSVTRVRPLSAQGEPGQKRRRLRTQGYRGEAEPLAPSPYIAPLSNSGARSFPSNILKTGVKTVSCDSRVGMVVKRRQASRPAAQPVTSANRTERSATASGSAIDVDVDLDESPVPTTPIQQRTRGVERPTTVSDEAPASAHLGGPAQRMPIDQAFQKVTAAVAGKTITKFVCCVQVYEYKREHDGTTVRSTRACGLAYKTKSRQLDRFHAHLKLHKNLTLITKAETATREAAVMQKFVAAAPQGAVLCDAPSRSPAVTAPLLCLLFARNGIPIDSLEDELFLSLLTFTPPRANEMPAVFNKMVAELMHEVADVFATPTVCVDVGTIRERYLLIAIVERGHVVITHAKPASAMPDKRMAVADVRDSVMTEIERLRKHGIFPISVVSTSALNRLGTVASDIPQDVLEEEAYEEQEGTNTLFDSPPEVRHEIELIERSLDDDNSQMLGVVRCPARCLDLIADDLKYAWGAAFEIAAQYRHDNRNNVILGLPMVDSTWQSKFRLIRSVIGKAQPNVVTGECQGTELPSDALNCLTVAFLLLRTLDRAWNFIRRDDATLFDSLCMMRGVLDEFKNPNQAEGPVNENELALRDLLPAALSAARKRFYSILTPLHLTLVYFMPFIGVTATMDSVGVVRATLARINPATIIEWEEWIACPRKEPLPTSEVTFEGYARYLTEILTETIPNNGSTTTVEYPELLRTILSIAKSCPFAAPIERTFRIMKYIAAPLVNRHNKTFVAQSLFISSADRTLRGMRTAGAPPEAGAHRAETPPVGVEYCTEAVRRRSQRMAGDWKAAKMTCTMASEILRCFENEKSE
jgi:hypothetical protein